jgi:hypothetical protein
VTAGAMPRPPRGDGFALFLVILCATLAGAAAIGAIVALLVP